MTRPAVTIHLVASLVVSLAASDVSAQRPSPECSVASQLDDRGTAAFLECARAATRKYKDQAAAVLDGYRAIGRDFPAMGQHWIHVGLLFDGKLDVERPEVLTYVPVAGTPTLLGVAYALPLLKGELPPDWPAGRAAWHDHSRTIEDETVLPQHHMSGHTDVGPRMAMAHAWLWSTNPNGLFAADNWAIPYLRLGIVAPEGAPMSAAKAVSLATGGVEYFLMSIDAAATPRPAERVAIESAFGRARSAVDALLQGRTGPALTADELARLSESWRSLWTAIDAAVRSDARVPLASLPIR